MRAGVVRAWAAGVVLLALGSPAAGQPPATGGTTTPPADPLTTPPPATTAPPSTTTPPKVLDSYGWDPSAAKPKLPEVKVPDVKAQDYFGPSTSSTFNEKTLFPSPPPTTPAPDGLPPPPPPDAPVTVPDGSLPKPPPRIWRGGAELGLNGSQGNSDVLSLRFGATANRKVDTNFFHMDLVYTFTNQEGATKQNQAILNARDEILFPGSPWSLFSALQVEYDQLRAYDVRAGTYGGFSYRWLKSEQTLLKTRLGAGAVREIDTRQGGPPDRWVPEAVIGGDLNHRFTDRQAFVSSLDVFPNLSQFGQFRVRARAGYEIVLDPTHGMVLRIGVQDRYDSSPGPALRNDLNYFTTLMFKF